MTHTSLMVKARGLALLCALLAGCDALWRLVRRPILDVLDVLDERGLSGLSALEFADLITSLCAVALLGAGGWFTLTTSLLAYAMLWAPGGQATRSQRIAHRLCPGGALPLAQRVVVGLALGTSLGTVLGAGAVVAPVAADNRDRAEAVTRPPEGISGLPVPDRTTDRRSPPAPARVVVRRGDCLWSIAAERGAEGASAAEIERAWRTVYRRNRHAVGPDPNLVLPGTVLHLHQKLRPPVKRVNTKEERSR